MLSGCDAAESFVHHEAARLSGLNDFGEPSYLEGLRRLLAALDADLVRDARAYEACLAMVVTPLVSRLYAEHGWTQNPHCLSQELHRPVFIVGAPRTGTTALHKLLSLDARWQGLHSWLVKTPMPRPPRESWERLPQYQSAVAAYDARLRATPALRFIHYVQPSDVDECNGLISQSMMSNAFGSNAHVPTYDSWLQGQDFQPVYRRLAKTLKLIGANDPTRRWLLKNPSHLLNLQALMDIFDDAVVIHIHRDPLKSMPSLWHLLCLSRQIRDGAAADTRHVVQRELKLWHNALMRATNLAKRYVDRICEVREDDFTASPMKIVSRIYEFAGETLTRPAERAMRGWLAANPKHKHGEQRYAAEDFGVMPQELATYFAAYRSHYGFAGP